MNLNELTIGIPKEIMKGEKRVAVTPNTVAKMITEGGTVLIEEGAGEGAFFPNAEYKKNGAKIINDVHDLYSKADIILKVKEPQFNTKAGEHEIDMMHEGQYLIAFIHPASPSNHDMVKKLLQKGIISFTLDSIPRISKAQSMDALTSMSTVAGYKSVLIAADRLSKFMPMITTAIGTIQPSNVLVIGAGIAGLQAVVTARRLGAVVYAADIRPDAYEQAKSVGAKLIDTGIPPEIAIGEGGYAKHLPIEWLEKEQMVLKEIIPDTDIIILTALVPGRVAPILITEEMVKSMKQGSIIMDVSIDQGGNCAITEAGNVTEKYGVIIDGTKNIPGMLPQSSTWMFANNIYNFISYIVKEGKIMIDMSDDIVASTLVTYGNKIIHKGTREAMKINN